MVCVVIAFSSVFLLFLALGGRYKALLITDSLVGFEASAVPHGAVGIATWAGIGSRLRS